LFDTSYFGKSSDRSSPTNGRYFVTANNLPFTIDVAETFDWVVEYQNITVLTRCFGIGQAEALDMPTGTQII
jgi:LruC domain-containing protein